PAFIKAVLRVKQAAAAANLELKLLQPDVASAINSAAEQQLLELDMANYPIDLFQTGSGTSTNMNVNEVLATLSGKSSGLAISPNDHINLGQSSNDVIPTAIHLSAALANHQLIETLTTLEAVIATKVVDIGHIVKTGRTHLMDAMPVTFAQVLSGWQAQIAHARQQLEFAQQQVLALAQGGTAVGTGINAHPDFAALFCQKLSSQTGLKFKPSSNFFLSLGSQDSIVALSGATKVLSVALMKIANDLRWMNSGPLAGLGEIALPALQPGSSIMPGKVNPVIPEAVAMVAAQVIGNDSTITVAGQSGNFELNVMLPVIAHNILQSMELLSSASSALGEKAIAGFTVQEDKINEALSRNPILVTALNPLIGYLKAADIAKQAYKEKRPVIDVAVEQTSYSRAELEKLLDPALLSQG
ncbi:MAG: aspartate ammonia-lyase, partial [Chromatiales bacterium RIFOXYA1_FULL_46_5]